MRELTLKVYYPEDGTDLAEDRSGFMLGDFTLQDLLARLADPAGVTQVTGVATHVDWAIVDVECPDPETASETDSCAAPAGAFIDQ